MFLRGLNILSILYSIPALFLAFSFHEFAHAYVADKLGDPTPRMNGRLTLSPLKHIDPLGFIFLLLGGFGWAKPVPIQPAYFKDRKKGEALTAAAGPLMNLCLAFVLAGLDMLLYLTDMGSVGAVVHQLIYQCVLINVVLMVFNLIPIPPLDGYRVLKLLYRPRDLLFFSKLERYGIFILILLMITGISSFVINVAGGYVLSFVYWPFQKLLAVLR